MIAPPHRRTPQAPKGLYLPSTPEPAASQNQLRESAVDVHAHHALHLLLLWFDGSSGPHDNYGSALTAQPGRLQERPATNTSPRLIVGGKWWTHRRLSCGAGSGVYVKAPSSSPGD